MSLTRRFLCAIGKHRLYRKQRLTPAADLVGCAHCSKEWGMNHDVRAFLPWDDELEAMYRRWGIEIDHGRKFPGVTAHSFPAYQYGSRYDPR